MVVVATNRSRYDVTDVLNGRARVDSRRPADAGVVKFDMICPKFSPRLLDSKNTKTARSDNSQRIFRCHIDRYDVDTRKSMSCADQGSDFGFAVPYRISTSCRF